MQMWMITKSLAPGVKHRKEADLGAQVLGVSRDGAQGLGRSPEQNVIDDLLVLQGNGGDGLRHGEDDMKILSVEKLGSTVFQPLGARQRLALWAVAITTTVVANPLVVTAIAAFDMTTKRRSSTQFDRAHDATLCGAERGAMDLTIGCAVAAEYIRHFRPHAGHRSETQKCFGGAGSGSVGTGRGSRSRGLDVEQT
jgi:hypothetical protein